MKNNEKNNNYKLTQKSINANFYYKTLLNREGGAGETVGFPA